MKRERRGENGEVGGGRAIGTRGKCERAMEDVVIGDIQEPCLRSIMSLLRCNEVDQRSKGGNTLSQQISKYQTAGLSFLNLNTVNSSQ